MDKTYVLYHGNCWDGFGAAWAAWNALGERLVLSRNEPWRECCAFAEEHVKEAPSD